MGQLQAARLACLDVDGGQGDGAKTACVRSAVPSQCRTEVATSPSATSSRPSFSSTSAVTRQAGGLAERVSIIGIASAQQLALARLVLADPSIAILDEATAEAGSAGARVLEAAAARALEGRTGHPPESNEHGNWG